MYVQMTGARMPDILREDRLQHVMQALDGGIVDVAGATPWLEQEKRFAVEYRNLEVVWILRGQASHRLGVGPILLDPLVCVELFDVTHGSRFDQLALNRGRLSVTQRHR